MYLEVEKKYKLYRKSFNDLKNFFDNNFRFCGTDRETNTLYTGNGLSTEQVLRIRELEDEWENGLILTYKNKVKGDFKSNQELEAHCTNSGKALYTILEALGYKKKIVYDKKRHLWETKDHENLFIYLDELPFGYYMEIEEIEANEGKDIKAFEKVLPFVPQEEKYSYPALTDYYGKEVEGIIEAKF